MFWNVSYQNISEIPVIATKTSEKKILSWHCPFFLLTEGIESALEDERTAHHGEDKGGGALANGLVEHARQAHPRA